MKNTIAVIASLFLVSAAWGQVQPASPFASQFVGAGIGYSQAAQPQQIYGGVVYAKLLSASAGTYSFTSIYDTSIALKPKFTVQTSTLTGGCVFTTSFASWDIFSCAQIGIALAGGTAGPGAAGTVLATRLVGKGGWRVGLLGGPSYSGAAGGGVSYPVGLLVGWGK